MKKIQALFLCVVMTVCMFAGCAQQASKVSDDEAKKFVAEATYAKDDRTGMCFAVIGSKTWDSPSQQGMSFTWVPCEQADKFIKK
jgi:hypothetical protein